MARSCHVFEIRPFLQQTNEKRKYFLFILRNCCPSFTLSVLCFHSIFH
uniref:Uncharacterized protein n=1 Tax=Anguilla anguilla TaxID=7936 RepID=A0A0E9WCA2_ANGAN